VVNKTGKNAYSFGLDADAVLGKSLAEFQTPKGKAVLRRNLDGSFAIRFGQRLQVYDIGKFDDVRLIATAGDETLTGALLQQTINGCTTYEFLNIRSSSMERVPIRPGCKTDVFVAKPDATHLILTQDVPSRAQFWTWENGTLAHGQQPAIASVSASPATTRASAPTPIPAPPQPVPAPSPASTPNGSPAPRQTETLPTTSATDAIASDSRPARRQPSSSAPQVKMDNAGITIPTGSIATEPMKPVTVVLRDEN
jgi:hypothetical protein